MSHPYRIAIVGLGVHGTGIAGRLLENPARFELVALVDASVATLMRFRSRSPRSRVPFFRSVAEALRTQPDAFFVATPAPAHVAGVRAIIEGGFSGPILIEKPVSNSVSEVDGLLDWISSTGWRGRAAVDFHRRCAGIYHELHRHVRSGELGAVVGMEFVRPCKLSMNGAHFADLGNWYAGSAPVSVKAELQEHSTIDHRGSAFFDPPGRVEVKYASGVRFELETRQREGAPGPFGMRVRLEHGELFIDDEETHLEIRSPQGVKRVASDKVQFGYNWIEATLLSLLDASTGFTPCSLVEARDALAVIVAAHVSHQAGGRPVALPLEGPERSVALRVA